jgi:GntR family transcriptional regulator
MRRTYRYQQIAERLREAISQGAYGDEGVLPSESELSAEHGASRVTIRKALEHLRGDGLVDSRQGFGWFVASDPFRQSLDSLETIEDQLAAAGRSSERRVLGFRFRDAPNKIAEVLGDEVLEVVRLNLSDEQPFALVTVWCNAAIAVELSRSDVVARQCQTGDLRSLCGR